MMVFHCEYYLCSCWQNGGVWRKRGYEQDFSIGKEAVSMVRSNIPDGGRGDAKSGVWRPGATVDAFEAASCCAPLRMNYSEITAVH